MNAPLYSRIALVTGVSSGIGEAIARQFIASGYAVIGNARRKDRLDELSKELGEAFHPVAGDASDEGVIQAMLNAGPANFGEPVNLVVANAGRGLGGSVLQADLKQYEEVIQTNLLGTVRLLQIAGNHLVSNLTGRPYPQFAQDIVVTGSTVGRHVSPFSAVYGSSKFAIHSVTEALRREIGPKGIRVSLIEPGIVLSEFQAVAGYSDPMVADFETRFGPLLAGKDIASVVDYLCQQPAHLHIGDVVIRPTRQDYP